MCEAVSRQYSFFGGTQQPTKNLWIFTGDAEG